MKKFRCFIDIVDQESICLLVGGKYWLLPMEGDAFDRGSIMLLLRCLALDVNDFIYFAALNPGEIWIVVFNVGGIERLYG